MYKNSQQNEPDEPDVFDHFVDRFGDMQVLKYKLPDFESLAFRDKLYLYYLSEAALSGRDILWDQNFRHNLAIRRILEAIIESYKGDRESVAFKDFLEYAKRVFFANGIHHHYSSDKLKPGFSKEYFAALLTGSDKDMLPVKKGETAEDLISKYQQVIFDDNLFSRKVERNSDKDMIAGSASNFYEGVTQKEVEDYYAGITDANDPRPVSTGLNSRVVKLNGIVAEEVYRSGGKYGPAIDRIIYWLARAREVAATDIQNKELGLLIDFYKSGNLSTWDEYNISWVQNTGPVVDYNNGFIETYEDPLGMKATWEANVNYRDIEASKRTEIITANAQWFEDNSPIAPDYKKDKVTGIAAKVINIAMLGGDCYPASPLGINLPNSDWIRKDVGSKSVTLANITAAHDAVARGNGFLEEFAADKAEVERSLKYGALAGALHTDLHECIGHASGRLADGTDPNALKNYASPLEEARADLVALYYMMDPKIIELGLLPTNEAAMAEYDSYLRNGLLTQMIRIKPGKDIEQAHMRCRSAISHWVYEKGKDEKLIEHVSREGKSYVKINNYSRVRTLFGQLLREIQRIKSEGDFEAGRKLIEEYGVRIDPVLHKEILARYEKLNLAPYTGFVNPLLVPVYDPSGNITDITFKYVDDYLGQMMYYGRNYSFLPVTN